MAGETILVVDDDEVVRAVVAQVLETRGYTVDLASDGQKALHLIHQGAPPDLVITDVSMPYLDGLELTRRLRAHHRTAHIPIIVLSNRKRPADLLAGYAEGADDYIPKPVQPSVLAAKVETLLRRARSGTQREAGPAHGKVIVFLAGKGGVGATTLAVNVAVGLILGGSYPVALLDLNLEFGNVSVSLDLAPKYSLADLPGAATEEQEESGLRDVIVEHATGLWVVVGSREPERAALVTPVLVAQTLKQLRDRAQHVIVDAPASFSDSSLAALDLADVVCVVATPQVGALKGTLDCLGVLAKLNVPAHRVYLVLNRPNPTGLTDSQVEIFLGRKPDLEVPYCELFSQASNSGYPFITTFRTDVAADTLRQAARSIAAMAAASS